MESTEHDAVQTPKAAIRDLPFSERGDALAEFVHKRVQEPDDDALREAAKTVAIREAVGVAEMAGMLSLAEVYDHLAEFATHYDGFAVIGNNDGELLESLAVSMPAIDNISHVPYHTLQTLYYRLTLESLPLYEGALPPEWDEDTDSVAET